MTLKVFLAGEGSNDMGGLAAEPEYQDPSKDGFFQPLLRRFSPCDLTFVGRQIKTLGRERVRELGDALARKAHQARELADYEQADVVVVAVDIDRTGGERRTMREMERRIVIFRDSLAQGFEASPNDVKPVIATPCRTVEAWGLADTAVACEVAGVGNERLPARPEELWGKPHDPRSNHPKSVLNRLFGGQVATRDYAEIATRASLTVLESECPRSFVPFAADVRAAFAECPPAPV